MRDYSSEYLDDNLYRSGDARSSDTLRLLAIVGAVALIAAPMIGMCARNFRARREQAKAEPEIDKTIADTFPASDPPASRYFDIPENRL